MPTYEKIAVQNLGSSASTVTFSSIAGDWTDLVFHINGRGTSSNNFDNIRMTINGSTADNQNQVRIIGQNITKECDKPTGAFIVGAVSGASATANYSGYSEVNILSYSSTTRQKIILYKSGTNNDSTSSSTSGSMLGYGFWNDTSAVTSIAFTLGSGGSFLTGSSFSLYGIKNS
jgi:hypothetical protein